jgi:2-methylcitrate synthase
MFDFIKRGGLAGVEAGQTAVCSVGRTGTGLMYRGYAIQDLVKFASFEEVSYLLIFGKLPTEARLAQFKQELIKFQALPQPICNILEQLPGTSAPMDVLRTACSALGNVRPEGPNNIQLQIATCMTPYLISALFYWHYFTTAGKRINPVTGQSTIAGHILALLHQSPPNESMRLALNTSLILYAEHEFNASTFAARVCVATGADFYGPITAAIATLSGPLHGGANEAAMRLIKKFATTAEAEQGVQTMLREKQLIMGFGHRVYTIADPRSEFMKKIASSVPTEQGRKLYEIAAAIELVVWNNKKLFPNLDYYSALVYDYLGFPVSMFTPLFVFARVSGWSAHIIEQRANNRLIRPNAEYIGPGLQKYVPLPERKD